MLAVTIATTFHVLPNKPVVITVRSAAGMERTTTKDQNMFVCVAETSPTTERANSGQAEVEEEITR